MLVELPDAFGVFRDGVDQFGIGQIVDNSVILSKKSNPSATLTQIMAGM
ncbi:hypothetical protein GCM10028819_37830 [Spirosoma humi]